MNITAQIFFETETDEYYPLENAQLLTFGVWDDPILYIPLEFDFYFIDRSINTLYSASGYHNELHTEPDADSTINILIPLFADLVDPGMLNGSSEANISYRTDGEAPYRICKIEWKNCGFYNEGEVNSTYHDRANFQVWLYETFNTIEYRYGDIDITDASVSLDTQGAYIGIVNNLHLSNNLNEAIDIEWHLTGYSIYPELSSGISTINDIYTATLLLDLPSNGTVYRFTTDSNNSIAMIDSAESVEIQTSIIDEVVQVKSNNQGSYTLFSTTGKLLAAGELVTGNTFIQVNNLSSGVYFLSTVMGQETKTFKLVKK